MILFIVIVVLVILLYLYGTRNYSYWEQKGVKYEKPIPFIGSVGRILANIVNMTDFFTELYKKYPEEKLVGYYFAQDKGIVVKDPELVKHVLATDFHYFYPRGVNFHKSDEPILKNLFFADGDDWKLLRQRMTPAFTSGKLKAMFPLIVERTEKLKNIALTAAKNGTEVDVRDLMARYTTDFIGACGFGIDTDAINDENSTFRKLGKRIFTPTVSDILKHWLKTLAPNMFKFLPSFPPVIEQTTLSIVRAVMEKRNYQPSNRNDFIDLLLELKNKGKIVGESIEHVSSDGTPKMVELEMDDYLMSAQVFVFFAAGFETSSSATSFMLHQLAFHPEIQKKCQDEIDEVLSRYDNKLCYDAVTEMKYLSMTFRESMRLFPSLGFLMRQSAKKYKFPGTDVTIDKGVTVVIPVEALQNDEKYFSDPNEFRPERFHSDNMNDIQNQIYMPFGGGPRACIGERLGIMQSLAGIAALLSEISVAPSENSKKIPTKNPVSDIVQSIKGGLPLSILSRKKNQ